MKRLLAAVLLLLAAAPAHASGTRAADTLAHMFTQAGNFGPPPYAADPFTCNASTERTTYYNTTAHTLKYCTGSAWTTLSAGGSAGITNGAASSGCTINVFPYIDSSGNVNCANPEITTDGVANTNPTMAVFGGLNTAKVTIRNNTGGQQFTMQPRDPGNAFVSFISASQGFTFDTALCISAAGVSNADACFARKAAGVIGTSTGAAWFQNDAGEGILNTPYTNATATFSATNLSRTLISGRTYAFDVYLYISESTAADGWQIDFNGGSVTITNFVVNCFSTNETGGAVALANATSAALATVINATTTTTTGGQLIECHGSIVPSNSSTFILRAAQNTHSSGTLTIKRGSGLALRDGPAL